MFYKNILYFIIIFCYCCNGIEKAENESIEKEFAKDAGFVIDNIAFHSEYYLKNSESKKNMLLDTHTYYIETSPKAQKNWAIILKNTWKDTIGKTEIVFCGYRSQLFDSEPVILIKTHLDTGIHRQFYYVSNRPYNVANLRNMKSIADSTAIYKSEKLSTLECLLNNIPDLKNFSLQNYDQLKIVKKLYIMTHVLGYKHYSQITEGYYLPNYFLNERITNEISNQKDLYFFIMLLNDASLPSFPPIKKEDYNKELLINHPYEGFEDYRTFTETTIKNKMADTTRRSHIYISNTKQTDRKNKAFLKTQLDNIRMGIQRDDVFFFYNIPALELYLLRVYVMPDGRIRLRHKFVNKKYEWKNLYYNFTADTTAN